MSRHHKRGNPALNVAVFEVHGLRCWLGYPGCTRHATTRDHVIPLAAGGPDTIENARPACRRCNSRRQDRMVSGMGGVTVVVVTGPPAAGKSTYVAEHAGPDDAVIDLDRLARALMPHDPVHSHAYPDHIRHMAIGARQAAISRAARLIDPVTVWLIHAIPDARALAEYRALRYRVVVIDPGRETVEARCRTMRPAAALAAVARWYDRAATSTERDAEPPPAESAPALAARAGPTPPATRPW